MKDRAIKETITQQTEILRNSKEAMATGIRRCLEEKSINPKSIIVAEWFPDDTSFEFGIIVTYDNKVYQFGYDYLDKPEGNGYFSEWENLTTTWRDVPHAKSIALALKENEKNT
jgi:hypothetical protein